MERCPCCNARLRERTVCSRCKSDLNLLINTEQTTGVWFYKALQSYLAGNIEQSIMAISVSLGLKRTQVAVVFREFIIQRQCRDILDLLAERQLILAKKRLYTVRKLLPYSMQLQQLNSFCDYLLAHSQDHSDLLPHSILDTLADIFHYRM